MIGQLQCSALLDLALVVELNGLKLLIQKVILFIQILQAEIVIRESEAMSKVACSLAFMRSLKNRKASPTASE